MRNTTILKISADVAMTVMRLLLMFYELIGDAIHEWLWIGHYGSELLKRIAKRKKNNVPVQGGVS